METRLRLSDFDHPSIINLAARLTDDQATVLEKIKRIFYFVRDEIKFGFTPEWDRVKASEVLNYGLGYCNTKATLFLALCRASGIDAKVHFGLIDIRIMRGIMPGFVFPFMPKLGGHSWIDVMLDGQWKSIDSYINDQAFYQRALERLQQSGQPLGYSLSFKDGKSSCEFNFGEQGFVHMGAVREDHGVWEDAAEYFTTDKYVRMNKIQAASYPLLAVLSNRNIDRIRRS